MRALRRLTHRIARWYRLHRSAEEALRLLREARPYLGSDPWASQLDQHIRHLSTYVQTGEGRS